MIYTLPLGTNRAQELDFSKAIETKSKLERAIKVARILGRLIPAKNSTPTFGYKAKKWGNGVSNSVPYRHKVNYKKCALYRV